ncbi:MAG: hypothetical protein KatS3mg103_1330 [Phycisphaerales bacterium]|nr:MAG: hypothetical protein KatS3mg103_1330 [Phycisphaerales bacterium]
MHSAAQSLRTIALLAGKDLRLLARDRVACFFTLVFPMLFGLLFGSVFSSAVGGQGPSVVRVAVAQLDGSEHARRFAQALRADPRLQVHPADDAQHAEELVRSGRVQAYLVVPGGFGRAAGMPFGPDPMRVVVGSGPSERATRAVLTGIATQALFDHLRQTLLDPQQARPMLERARASLEQAQGLDPARRSALRAMLAAAQAALSDPAALPDPTAPQVAGDEPADRADAPGLAVLDVQQAEVHAQDDAAGSVSPFAISFPQAALWAVMGCTAGFGVSLVGERSQGTMMRLRAAPIGRWHIVLGKALACMLAAVAVSTVLLALAWALLGLRPVAPLQLGVAVLAVAVCFVGIMMLLAAVGTSESAAAGVGWASLLTLAMIGGGAIPLAFMPPWLHELASISPVKWGILAIEGGLWRGLGWRQMITPLAVLLGVGAVAFALGAWAFARREFR